MRIEKPKKVRLNLRISPQLEAELQRYAKKTGLSLTAIVEVATVEYLRERERQAA